MLALGDVPDHPGADDSVVLVHDGRLGSSFELEVDASSALDAFDHPYAYAAFRGVEYTVPRRRDQTIVTAI